MGISQALGYFKLDVAKFKLSVAKFKLSVAKFLRGLTFLFTNFVIMGERSTKYFRTITTRKSNRGTILDL
jgi:hypothetical protein